MLAVICCLWGTRYGAGHVRALKQMTGQYLSVPHRFVCLTDRDGIDGVETRPLRPLQYRRRGLANFAKLHAFDGELQRSLGRRIVFFDLDVVLLGDITGLVLESGEFAIMKGTLSRSGERQLAPYNSSFWVCEAGAREHFLSTFCPDRIDEIDPSWVGTDQAWIGHVSPDERTVGEADGLYQFCRQGQDLPAGAKAVFFAGHIKPWNRRAGWLGEIYRQYLTDTQP